jgi:hypothetical protein
MRAPKVPSECGILIELLSLILVVLMTNAARAETVKVEGGLLRAPLKMGSEFIAAFLMPLRP